MGAGTETTAKLHPAVGSAITFDMGAGEGLHGGYVIPAQSLRLRLASRRSVKYSERSTADGGEANTSRGALVELSFDVIVSGKTRAEMLQYYSALEAAVGCQYGGSFEWKADDLAAGVRSSFFVYEESGVPGLKQVEGNRLDGPAKEDGRFRVVVEVRLMTQPWCWSDPENPVSVLSTTTIKNTDDGSRNNYVTVPASAIKGDKPALARLLVTPKTSGADINRLIVSRRTEGLTTFKATYNTATFLAPLSAWSTVTDSNRSGGSYYKCLPAVNNVPYGLRYTISNWSDHKGSAAIAVVHKAFGENVDDAWEMYAAWSIADTPFQGEARAVQSLSAWRVLVLPELDIPEAEMSDLASLDLYIDIYIKRIAGSGSIGIDCIQLVYADEAVVEAEAVGDGKAGTSNKILIENFEAELAHIIDGSNKLQYILNPLGTPGLITLRPGVNNRLDFLWERAVAGLADDFGGYSANWTKLASGESSETWTSELYRDFLAVAWRASSAATTYPVDIVNGGLNTATLVSNSKMRSDGNDLRVFVDGAEADRWLDGINTTTTKIWVNLDFSADVPMTLNGAIDSDDTSLIVNEAITGLGSTGIVKIGSEIIYYGAKDGGTKTLSSLIRGYKGSTAASHSDSDTVQWIQCDIEIVYGDLEAAAPTIDDDYKPAFDLGSSTNTLWVYTEFGDNNDKRAGGWVVNHIEGQDTPPALGYKYNTGNHTGDANPWADIGIRYYTTNTVAEVFHGRWELWNVCGITQAVFANGERYWDQGDDWAGPSVQYYNGSWTSEYAIPAPPSAAWYTWSRTTAALSNTTAIALRSYTNVPAATATDIRVEVADVTVTLDSDNTPTVTIVGERQFDETDQAVEGDTNRPVVPIENAVTTRTAAIEVLLGTTALLCVHFFMDVYAGSTAQSITIRLKTNASNYYYKTWSYTETGGATYEKIEEILISAMSTVGSPDLTDIAEVEFEASYTTAMCTFYVDDVRVVAADPGDANSPNDTGAVWDFPTGTWHVYELDTATKYLGQIETTTSVEKVALVHTNYGADVTIAVACMAKRDDGMVGIVFRCSDGTGGSEDCYACLLDTSNDQLVLREYVGGTPTNVATAVYYVCAKDTLYYLGVKVEGSDIQCFVSTSLSTLWNVTNRKFNVSDSTHSTGQVGLMTIGTLGRFTSFDLDSVADRHVTDDQIDVEIKAIFQSAVPFYE